MPRQPFVVSLAVVVIASLFAACGPSPKPSTRELIVWQKLASWSGRGVLQTDPFISDSGMLRVEWETRNQDGQTDGTLRVSLHSAISGRHLALVIDHQGAGRDTQYVNEDPRAFFLVIESSGIEWSVEVAEGIPARQDAARRP